MGDFPQPSSDYRTIWKKGLLAAVIVAATVVATAATTTGTTAATGAPAAAAEQQKNDDQNNTGTVVRIVATVTHIELPPYLLLQSSILHCCGLCESFYAGPFS